MTRVIARLEEEGRKVLAAAIFFAIGFCVIVFHDRLLTQGSGFQTATFARALVGGLIVAKVLLTVDLLPFVDAFPHKPLIYNIAWKTSLYTTGALVFLYIEPFMKDLVRGTGLYPSHSDAWHQVLLPRTWSTVIWVVVLLLMFVTMKEMRRVLGHDELKHMFLGSKRKPAKERSRSAA